MPICRPCENAVAAYLNANTGPLFIDDVMAGDELRLTFNDPAFDNRTPDIIVQPIYGTIYSTSGKKVAEHGGFSFGDTNLGLIVSNPRLRRRVLKTTVATSQVAPTVLQAPGPDPDALDAVRKEETQPSRASATDGGSAATPRATRSSPARRSPATCRRPG